MVRFDPKWKTKMIINGFGAMLTSVVMLVFAVTKFVNGAWVVVVLIPSLVFLFFRIHEHYKMLVATSAWKRQAKPVRLLPQPGDHSHRGGAPGRIVCPALCPDIVRMT